MALSGFSREHGYRRCPLARGLAVLSGSAHGAYFTAPRIPTPLNVPFRRHAGVSLLRPRFARAAGCVILNAFPSGPPFGFPLGPGLP